MIEVLQISVPLGARKWSHFVGDEDGGIKWHVVEMGVKRVLAKEEAWGMRIEQNCFLIWQNRRWKEGFHTKIWIPSLRSWASFPTKASQI